MRSTLSPSEFFTKMKKKPALQKILDNLDDYTLEELENIKGQPLWIRKELIKIKEHGMVDWDALNEAEAKAQKELEQAENRNRAEHLSKEYEVRRWIGPEWQMPTGMEGGLKLDINHGDVFLITDPEQKMVKISSSIGKLANCWQYFIANTEYIGHMGRGEFSNFLSNILAQKHGLDNNINHKDNLDDPNVDDRGLFKIIRH